MSLSFYNSNWNRYSVGSNTDFRKTRGAEVSTTIKQKKAQDIRNLVKKSHQQSKNRSGPLISIKTPTYQPYFISGLACNDVISPDVTTGLCADGSQVTESP